MGIHKHSIETSRKAAAKKKRKGHLHACLFSLSLSLSLTSITMAKPTTISIDNSAVLLLFLTPFLLLLFPIGAPVLAGGEPVGAVDRYLPAGPIEYRPAGGGRRVLAPFQLCLQCRCCVAGDPTNCTSMSCCFGINCALPDKPYGVCAFVPKTCDCASCA